jgi:hypothetical protein
MKLPIKIGLIGAGIYIILELILLFTGLNKSRDVIVLSLGANTLILVLIVALSILINFNRNKHGGLSMIVDLKMGIIASAIYSVIISSFLFLYFSVLDPSYPEMRKQQIIAGMQNQDAIDHLNESMEANPDNYAGKSSDDIQEMNHNNVEHMLSANTVFPLALFSLFFLGMVYSFFVMAFNRMILSKL